MKRPIIISCICVALTLVIMLWGFQQREAVQQPQLERYALLVDSDTGSFFMQLRKGMQQAADESGVKLSVYTRGMSVTPEELTGAMIWRDDPAEALRQLDGIPTILIDRSVSGAASVLSDDQSAGEQLMQYALERAKSAAIVLVRDDEDQRALTRGNAAAALASGKGVAVVDYRYPLQLPADCEYVVATSRRATEELAAQRRDGGFAGRVLGVDTGDRRVPDLEDGLVDAMALDSPYAMGYLALTRLRRSASGERPGNAYASVLLATKENMYLAENVKQVFPLLQ